MLSMASASDSGVVLRRPEAQVAENDAVHVAAANPDDRRAARLAFQRHQAEGFLHAGMHEQIRRAVEPGEFGAGRCNTAARSPPRFSFAAR